MYLLDRQKKILTLLISGNGWITGEKIGSALGITDRTVRNDIRIIMYKVFRKRFDSWNGGKRIYASAGGRCCNHYSYANSL